MEHKVLKFYKSIMSVTYKGGQKAHLHSKSMWSSVRHIVLITMK